VKGPKKAVAIVLAVIGALFLAIQFVPVDRSNPAVQTQVPASAEARAVLKKACYDCHSNETVWPWYSYVAPISWLVSKDVVEGRQELNFSTWNLYSAEAQREGMGESVEKVQEGEMPLWFYTPLHPAANLSAADKAVLAAWAGVSNGNATESGTQTDKGTTVNTNVDANVNAGTGANSGTGDGTTVNTGGYGEGATGGFGGEGGESSGGGGDGDNDGDDD
jgi:hypothetical protein